MQPKTTLMYSRAGMFTTTQFLALKSDQDKQKLQRAQPQMSESDSSDDSDAGFASASRHHELDGLQKF